MININSVKEHIDKFKLISETSFMKYYIIDETTEKLLLENCEKNIKCDIMMFVTNNEDWFYIDFINFKEDYLYISSYNVFEKRNNIKYFYNELYDEIIKIYKKRILKDKIKRIKKNV